MLTKMLFNYVVAISVVVMCINIKLYSCASESEEGLDDILNPTTTSTKQTEQTQESTFQVPDDRWLATALQDIAYFLRNHKFNEWDRRHYMEKPKDTLIGFYIAFPDPGLRAIHWKVYENCYKDFYDCIKYLYSVIETAPFTRSDDITTTLNNNYNITNTALTFLDNNCKKALLYTDRTGLPFDAPTEKFQWRTSASYYMCWYTMLGVPALSMLGESCDNFANCLDSTYGNRNHDPRSDDKLAFACAMYSFCPDPCCPLKHVKELTECYNSESNPCLLENAQSADIIHRQCRFDRKDNKNFDDIVNNKWNVSCHCEQKGFEWRSQFGMCVDVNECTRKKHTCDVKTENCLNLPGTFKCICKWGYAYNPVKKRCIANTILKNSSPEKNDTSAVGFFENFNCFLRYLGF